jgi:hypothetical protein
MITHRFLLKAKRGKYREENFPVMRKTHSKCYSTLCKKLTFDTTLTKFILVTPSPFSFISSYLKEKRIAEGKNTSWFRTRRDYGLPQQQAGKSPPAV